MKKILAFTSHFSLKAFLLIIIIILVGTSTALVKPLGFNQNHQIATAQRQGEDEHPEGLQNDSISSNISSQRQLTSTDGASFELGNTTFFHHMATVSNGTQMHYVIGGHGDPVVLLHGWPETWFEWHKVMPSLAEHYTVIVPDLPGLGNSSKALGGYDGKSVAQDIHQLVSQQLGSKSIFLAGHDIGAQMAYSYAAAYPAEVRKLVIIDFTGFLPGGRTLWWSAFHQAPNGIPETLVQGKEKFYLSWFYQNLAYNLSAIGPDIDEYVSHYSAPGSMHAGFEYYRAYPQNAIDNENYSKATKLTMPVLAIASSYIPALGGNITANGPLKQMQALAQNVQGMQVANSGHWIPEEHPGVVRDQLFKFFGNNSNTTSGR